MTELTGRQMDVECFINLFKSLHGYKPRNISDWSDAVLTAEIKSLGELVREEILIDKFTEEFHVHANENGMDRDMNQWDLETECENFVILKLNEELGVQV
jgi:hypothetical protein